MTTIEEHKEIVDEYIDDIKGVIDKELEAKNG
jgi:hypothetical protein